MGDALTIIYYMRALSQVLARCKLTKGETERAAEIRSRN